MESQSIQGSASLQLRRGVKTVALFQAGSFAAPGRFLVSSMGPQTAMQHAETRSRHQPTGNRSFDTQSDY